MPEAFDEWFKKVTGIRPGDDGASVASHSWQRSLASATVLRSQLIRIPTGMGKTLGVLAAWSWHRLHRADNSWPRRLVWCLPMRVLAEQTEAVVREAISRVGLLWSGSGAHAGKVGVHLLMGGAEPGGEWNLFPEESAVLIGTQDMLLSRSLNRGYASGRARWPLEFGLLSHDALWVMDEVQLMDVGLATSAQLQAFQDDDAIKGLRPRHTWWMSATLQPAWLKTVDTAQRHAGWCRDPVVVAPEERHRGLGSITKTLATASIPAQDSKSFAQRVLDEHSALVAGEHGRITLVVCNRVDQACTTFDTLHALGRTSGVELVHSRFRPAERNVWRERFLSRAACTAGVDRIIVTTQVVEAGVDISAGCVVTELSPWPSLVQRFGRCARYGGTGHVVVVDRGRDEKTAPPYGVKELDAAWAEVERISEQGNGVGTARLEAFEEGLDDERRKLLYPYAPRHLLLRREFDELFDTTPDLTGADLDISRFIRSGDERDLQVFWLDVAEDKKGAPRNGPSRRRQPGRDELCAVPFLRARDWLCGEETTTSRKPRLRGSVRAWVWDWLDGEWVVAERALLTPGRVVCVAADAGGYRVERGFDPESNEAVPPLPATLLPGLTKVCSCAALTTDTEAQFRADASHDGEDLSAASWKTIACHAGEVAATAAVIAAATKLPAELERSLVLAGQWHDLGKAHPAFQGAIRLPAAGSHTCPRCGKAHPARLPGRPNRQDLAKAPKAAWPRRPKTYRTIDDKDVRPGLRHELASALALFAVLRRHQPRHPALLGPWIEALGLIGCAVPDAPSDQPPTPSEQAVLKCSADEFDLLAYLVASHHGKVRIALHAAPKDQDYRDNGDGRGLPIRGVREGDELPAVVLDDSALPLPSLRLSLEPATLGLSPLTGRSWRERTLGLVDRFGPGALAWLEALFIAADRRASQLTTVDPLLAPEEESQ
ncbi:MAG: type I-G CRISPR-associated helicase/endonuclease Cas3g [Myxococcaceae bacterium]